MVLGFLNEFRVQQSNIKVIPDFRIVRGSIDKISIKSSRLTSLEGKHLQNLTFLTQLSFFNNSIRFIDPDVFKGTERIQKLDLSCNFLTSIPPNLLDPMKLLQIFNASLNNLLHVDNLFSIVHPEHIYLFSNNITDIKPFLRYMGKIETLALSDNPIKTMNTIRFFQHVGVAKHLFLSHCGFREFSIGFFSVMPIANLVTLDLSYNLIGGDSDGYSENVNGKEYDGVRLEINTLNLIGNNLRRPDAFLIRNQFLNVKFAQNRIQYLSEDDFIAINATENIELQENQIRRIDTNTFKTPRKILKKLDLSSNLISSLNGSVRYLSELTLLNLTNNLIQTFARDEFAGLNDLLELYLQHNHIKTLWQFDQLPALQHLNIANNDIKLITRDHVPKTLKYMDLADNPFECDCRLQPFILRLNTKDSLETDVDLCLQSDLGNNLNETSVCPDICFCECTKNGSDYFMSVDCSSKSLTVVPQFLRNSFTLMEDNKTITSNGQSFLVMKQNIYPSLDIADRVLNVNLENNSLESLGEDQLPPNLTQLYLANNKLTRLPESLLDKQVNLKYLSLSGNPWSCDCNALKLKKWLTSKHDIIQDIDNVRCGINDKGEFILNGRVIWMLTDLDLCPTDIGLIIPVSFGVLTIMTLCLATTILYTKYNLNIKVFLYSHGFTFVKEEDIDCDKEFDAFMAFSNKDGEFVTKEIITVIEDKDPSIHMCIHYRHFMAGEFIYNNIVRAIRNSKRTVVILSENFIRSEWCLLEFRTAYMQSLQDKVPRIIVIKVGDIPKETDPAIKVHLDSITYLTWGEKNFWNKLFCVLPTTVSAQNLIQEV